MGYSIIFETKVILLKNGDVLHLSLSGCNNDEEGRDRNQFVGTRYTKEDWLNFIEKYEKMPKMEDGFDLKIGNRYCQMQDYGKHLRTMYNRATTLEELQKTRTVYAYVVDGYLVKRIGVNEPWVHMSLTDYKTKLLETGEIRNYHCKYNILKAETEEEILKLLQQFKMTTRFFVSRKHS